MSVQLDSHDRITIGIAGLELEWIDRDRPRAIAALGAYIERTYRDGRGFDPAKSHAATLLRKLVTPPDEAES